MLGCHWVYTYKLDKHVRLKKIKARLVIRGEQLPWDDRETYAATLAGMSFRTLIAIANSFDCCWLRDKIIFFHYVDDCVLAFPREHCSEALELLGHLQKQYFLEGSHDLQWFLSMEVIRDRFARRLWLSQSVYVNKIARQLATREAASSRVPITPIRLTELLPYNGEATNAQRQRYQQDVGGISVSCTPRL